MKALKIILIFLLFSLTVSAQIRQDIPSFYRGDSKNLIFTSFSIADTATTYRFAMKANDSLTAQRRIYKATYDGITYSYNTSTKKVTLTIAFDKSDTWGLAAKTYLYDIEAVNKADTNKTTTVLYGNFVLKADILTPYDNTDYLTSDVRYFPVAATSFDEGEFIKKSGTSFVGELLYSKNEVNTITAAKLDTTKATYAMRQVWTNKQDALGYTPLDKADSTDAMSYTTKKQFNDGIGAKADTGDVYSRTALNAGQLDTRYYTESEVNTIAGTKLDTTKATFAMRQAWTNKQDALGYTPIPEDSVYKKTELNSGQLDVRYYTKDEIGSHLSLKANLISPSFTTPDIGDANGDSVRFVRLNVGINTVGNYSAAVGTNSVTGSYSLGVGGNVNITAEKSFGSGAEIQISSKWSGVIGLNDYIYSTHSYGNNFILGRDNIIGQTNPTNTYGNWLFGSYLRSESKGLWVLGADNTFAKKIIPYHDQIVFWNEPLTIALSDPNDASALPSRSAMSFQNFDTSDSTEYKFGIQKPTGQTYSNFGLWAFNDFSADGGGGLAASVNRRLFNIDNSGGQYDILFNDSKTDAHGWGNVKILNGNFEVTNGIVDADSFKISGVNILPKLWEQSGTAIESNTAAPYKIHSFTTTERDSWTPANGWLFRNSTLSVYQVYESGWQTLASGEWVATQLGNYWAKSDTTSTLLTQIKASQTYVPKSGYTFNNNFAWNGTAIGDSYISSASTWNAKVGYSTSTAGYVPYYSSAGVLSNSGIYFDGTNVGIGTTGPQNLLTLQKTDVQNSITGMDFFGTITGPANLNGYNNGRIYTRFDGDTYSDARLTLAYPTGSGTFADGLSLKNGNVGINKTTNINSKLAVVGLPTYADNAAAVTGGLTVGDFYKTSTGQLMVVYE